MTCILRKHTFCDSVAIFFRHDAIITATPQPIDSVSDDALDNAIEDFGIDFIREGKFRDCDIAKTMSFELFLDITRISPAI